MGPLRNRKGFCHVVVLYYTYTGVHAAEDPGREDIMKKGLLSSAVCRSDMGRPECTIGGQSPGTNSSQRRQFISTN